jgi:hypothetical protein
MHDTVNLKKRLKECEQLLNLALISNNHPMVNFYNSEIRYLEERIESRKRNKVRNEKAYRKAHGHSI